MLEPGDPRHGTENGYGNQGCRCDECRRAHADKMRNYFERYPEQREKRRIREHRRYHEGRAVNSRGKGYKPPSRRTQEDG